MNVLVIGSGGREHAISWKIAQSKLLNQLFIAPGNAGTAKCGTNVAIKETDFEGIKKLVLDKDIQLVVVGPEAPLVEGITDYFKADELLRDVTVVGPTQAGAQLEGSKDFSKQFMQKYNIPTAAYNTFTSENLEEGYAFLETLKAPYVLKADGLAAGKGVLILNDLQEAKAELKAMIQESKFGAASAKVVIEEFLDGIELSVFVLTDGTNYKLLPAAKDYKRIGEGDTGLNTGGMGAISPVPFANEAFIQKVDEQIVQPTIQGLKAENIDYQGFIFIGLMNVNNNPYVIEYNVRMGDPETEVVFPRIESDVLALFKALENNTLNEVELEITPKTAATVMLVSGGYPESYEKGKVITGLEAKTNSQVFVAGAQNSNENQVLTSGGRVLSVTSWGDSIQEAVSTSYATIQGLSFDKMYYRKDIGQDLMNL